MAWTIWTSWHGGLVYPHPDQRKQDRRLESDGGCQRSKGGHYMVVQSQQSNQSRFSSTRSRFWTTSSVVSDFRGYCSYLWDRIYVRRTILSSLIWTTYCPLPTFSPTLESWIKVTVAIFTRDDIKVHWEGLQHTSRYKRYKERDVNSEATVANRSGVRVEMDWEQRMRE